MSSDIRAELDTLHSKVDALVTDVAALTRMLGELREPAEEKPARRPEFPGMAALWEATEPFARRAEELGARGLATFAGCYTGADGREYRWQREKRAEDLLAQDDDLVAQVLAALGHKQRLALLKAILEQPATAAELIARLGLTSAGQAYHHLNTLTAAGLIRQAERGQYSFVGHQGPAFLTLLAGVWSMLYTRYGTGTWGEAGQSAMPPSAAPTAAQVSGE